MSKPTPKETKALIKAFDDLVTEIYQSGCVDYMNESSKSAKIFNKRLARATACLAKAKA